MILALCINVLINSQASPESCQVLEDSKEIWVVECAGKVLKLPDYACVYEDGSDKRVVVND